MGIDLGTTYSCVGIFKDGEAKFNAFSSDVWHREPLCFLDLFGTVGSISLQAVFYFFGGGQTLKFDFRSDKAVRIVRCRS